MTNLKNLLLIGPFPEPITGVSLANEVLKKGLIKQNIKTAHINTQNQKTIKENTGLFNLKQLSFVISYLHIYKIFYSKIVYITIGQTFFGVIKYLPFLAIAKLCNAKTVVHLHGGFLKSEYQSQKGVKKRLMLSTLKLFDFGIVLSKSLKTNLSFFLEDNNIFVCNNFYQSYLLNKEQPTKDYNTPLRLVFLSNLLEGKGINLLLKALKNINSDKIHVKIAGDIPKENQRVIETMETIPNLDYLGVVNGQEKIDVLAWGQVFCLPTFYIKGEGQPISIIEAMAFGQLILTTKHGGIPDICSEKNAIFVKKNNLEDLESKISSLLNNTTVIKQKGAHNESYAKANFTEEKFIQNMIQIFKACKS